MLQAMYDYTNQSWTVGGVYVTCGHPATMDCKCYGKLHAGEAADLDRIQEENL